MSAFEEAMSLGHWKAQAETSAETRVTSSCRRSSSLSSDGSDLEVRGSSRLGSGAVCAGSAVPFDRDVLKTPCQQWFQKRCARWIQYVQILSSTSSDPPRSHVIQTGGKDSPCRSACCRWISQMTTTSAR